MKVQTKKDEFLEQFAELNAHIESALEMHDFDRARRIDGALEQRRNVRCVVATEAGRPGGIPGKHGVVLSGVLL